MGGVCPPIILSVFLLRGKQRTCHPDRAKRRGISKTAKKEIFSGKALNNTSHIRYSLKLIEKPLLIFSLRYGRNDTTTGLAMLE